MISMEIDDWIKSCEMIQGIHVEVLNKNFQLYPFSILSDEDWKYLKSENFFKTNIQSGYFLTNQEDLKFPYRNIQKGDGSYRKTYLVSPLVYLFLNAIGAQVEKHYCQKRKLVYQEQVFYSGNYSEPEVIAHYKKTYNKFCSYTNAQKTEYKYFFKTDISNFFPTVNVSKLFKRIDFIETKSSLIYSELVSLIGEGKMPIVDGNTGLSYLNTIVYLDLFDTFLESKMSMISKVKNYTFVRYVDDLYIFLNCEEQDCDFINARLYDILFEVSGKFDLNINFGKTEGLKPSGELSKYLIQQIYDFYVYGEDIDFDQYFSSGSLEEYLSKLLNLSINASYQDYQSEVLSTLSNGEIEIRPMSILNSIAYNQRLWCGKPEIIATLKNILYCDFRKIRFAVKPIITIILNTGDGSLIRMLLNKLFDVFRANESGIIDEIILIEYLTQRNFRHEDLMKILNKMRPEISHFIKMYCADSFVSKLKKDAKTYYYQDGTVYDELERDSLLNFLKYMKFTNLSQGNLLQSYAYQKNYFDRLIAHTMKCFENDKKSKPNFKKYYQENSIKDSVNRLAIFDEKEVEYVIKEASNVRNSNPVSHASGGLFNPDDLSNDRVQDISANLDELIVGIDSYLQSDDRGID